MAMYLLLQSSAMAMYLTQKMTRVGSKVSSRLPLHKYHLFFLDANSRPYKQLSSMVLINGFSLIQTRICVILCLEVYKGVCLFPWNSRSRLLQPLHLQGMFILPQYSFDISLRHPGVDISDKKSVRIYHTRLKKPGIDVPLNLMDYLWLTLAH